MKNTRKTRFLLREKFEEGIEVSDGIQSVEENVITSQYPESRGEKLPTPRVKKGKWSKERERTKKGRWRKKRSDAGKKRKKKNPNIQEIEKSLC